MPKDDRRPSTPRQSPRRNRFGWHGSVLRLLLLLVAAAIVVDALIGEQGTLAVRHARRHAIELKANLARELVQNVLRQDERQRLQDDASAIEDAARRDLGLIRRGEKVFIIKNLPSPARP